MRRQGDGAMKQRKPMTLEQRWDELWSGYPTANELERGRVKRRLWAHYQDGSRKYHNLEHIDFCFKELDPVITLAANPTVVKAATFFHDVIYNTHRRDNEKRSADYAAKCIQQLGGTRDFWRAVRKVILATRHRGDAQGADEQFMCDIDLAGLGQPYERFAADGDKIRQEYSWVSMHEFCTERAKILQTFLNRKDIYYLPYFGERYEAQARDNLTRAIRQLQLDARLSI